MRHIKILFCKIILSMNSKVLIMNAIKKSLSKLYLSPSYLTKTLTAASFIIAIPIAALASELPERKPGLWESSISLSTAAGQKQIIKECVSKETDQKMLLSGNAALPNAKCQNSYNKSGSSYNIEVKCSTDKMSMIARNTLSGDFNSNYSGKTEISGVIKQAGKEFDLPPQTLTLTSSFKGACPSNMKAGDVISPMPGGGEKKFNIMDMKKNKK